MSRVKAILAAGTLTGLVLVTILALSLGNAGQASASNQAAPVGITQPSGSVASLQASNAQLQQSLQTMQAREAQYQAQIEQANQTIMQLQSQPATVTQSRIGLFGGEAHERWEHDD